MIKEQQAELIFSPLFLANTAVNGLLANQPSLNTEASYIIEQNGKSMEASAR